MRKHPREHPDSPIPRKALSLQSAACRSPLVVAAVAGQDGERIRVLRAAHAAGMSEGRKLCPFPMWLLLKFLFHIAKDKKGSQYISLGFQLLGVPLVWLHSHLDSLRTLRTEPLPSAPTPRCSYDSFYMSNGKLGGPEEQRLIQSEPTSSGAAH